MSTVAFIRRCLAAGMDFEAALVAAEAYEAEPPQRSKGAERTARWREKRASQNVTVTVSDARDACDVLPPEVRPLSPRTPLTPTPTPPETTTRAHTSARRPAKRVPDGWEPKPSTLGKLAEEGFTPGDIERALTRMRDHEFKTAHTDWDAALRNWVRTDRDRQPRMTHERPHPSDKFDRKQANLARAFAAPSAPVGQRWEP